VWNKKNDQYASSCGLRQSSEKLTRWLLRRTRQNEVCEIEIDLKTFNQEIARHRPRGGYDRKTLKEALAQINEKTQGWILITKSYSWSVHKILIRPLNFLVGEKSPSGDSNPKLTTGNPMFSEDHKKRVREQQQQDIAILDEMLTKVGLKFTGDNLHRLWRMSGKDLGDIKTALEYLFKAHTNQTKPIKNPHGFLMECLKHRWHDVIYEQECFKNVPPGTRIMGWLDELVDSLKRSPIMRS
jgi:hypothetical protein